MTLHPRDFTIESHWPNQEVAALYAMAQELLNKETVRLRKELSAELKGYPNHLYMIKAAELQQHFSECLKPYINLLVQIQGLSVPVITYANPRGNGPHT